MINKDTEAMNNFSETYFLNYKNFLQDILNPSWSSYFYWFIFLSIFVYSIEIIFPWRHKQGLLRKGFWLDLFYSFFNLFFIHIAFLKISSIIVLSGFDALLAPLGWQNYRSNNLDFLPLWGQILALFIFKDFIQWNIHRLLHKSDLLWRFHQVHHSVEEMGFAAHLRYHWLENVFYNTMQYLPLVVIGFGLDQYLFVYIITVFIGHLNHANTYLPLGPLRYVFNSPQMHIWHHAKNLPEGRSACNFGLSLSCWDYLFKTAYMPSSGRDIELGFAGVEKFPKSFLKQLISGFKSEE